MNRRASGLALAALCIALAVSACAEVKATSSSHYKPAALSSVAGSQDVKQVTFTEEAAGRVGLRTALVRPDAGMLVVPSEAIIYNPNGQALVYTATSPLTFVRAPVTVTRSDARDTWVSSGPPAGTAVVTTGASEVYGAEFEVGH